MNSWKEMKSKILQRNDITIRIQIELLLKQFESFTIEVITMGGATLRNVMRMIVALENAPEIKKTLRERGGPCWAHRDYCKCETEELCNLALAEFLGINPGTALRSWRNLMFEMEELGVIETRLAENPRNRPRRLLKLTKDWREAFNEIYAKTKKELFEKWEI